MCGKHLLAELPLQPHRNNTLLPSNTLSPAVHAAALNKGSQLRRRKRARETAQEVKELALEAWKLELDSQNSGKEPDAGAHT